MLKHFTVMGAALLMLNLPQVATAQEEVTADTVVATVGETEITLGEVIMARQQLPPQYANFPNEDLFNGLIDQLIQQQLLADELERVPPKIDYTLLNDRRALEAAEVINEIAANALTEEDVQAAYDERFTNAEDVIEYNASHLLVETEEEAETAKNRIDEGEAFEDVARDVSTGPTGPNGGNLGWFGPGAMVPEFENTISALEVGDVSEPFETQFGWHLATLNETRVQAKPTLDEVRNRLVNDLQEAAVTARLEELAADQEVTKPEPGDFDADLIDQIDLLD